MIYGFNVTSSLLYFQVSKILSMVILQGFRSSRHTPRDGQVRCDKELFLAGKYVWEETRWEPGEQGGDRFNSMTWGLQRIADGGGIACLT